MRGKHVIFGPDGSVGREEEVDNWSGRPEASSAVVPR